MAEAKRDANFRPTLLAVSNVDGTTTVDLYADPATHRLLVQNDVLSGAVAPVSTPSSIGQIYVDTILAKIYISAGTTNSNDWKVLN